MEILIIILIFQILIYYLINYQVWRLNTVKNINSQNIYINLTESMDSASSRQGDIQKMLFHVGEKVRYLLQSTTLIYRNNKINFSVIDFHEKVMRLIAPPFELLGFDDQQGKEQPNTKRGFMAQYNQNSSRLRKQYDLAQHNSNRFAQKYQRRHLNLNQLPKMPYMKNRYENDNQIIEQENLEQNPQKRRIFLGNNPTGVYKQIKQYEQSKGLFVKKSMKTLRHINKFIMNYEENQARKNDPNRIPKRRPRRPKVDQDQQIYTQNKDISSKRGRKVQDEVLQQQILSWFGDQISRGKKLRKVDLRNQLRLMSGGRLTGSTGWCRRFLGRHPQIKTWFQKTYRAGVQNSMISVKTPPITKKEQQIQEWIHPQNSKYPENSQESQSQSNEISSQFQPSFFNEQSIVRQDQNKMGRYQKIQKRQNNKK